MTSLPPAPKIAPGLVWRLLDNSAVVVSPRSGEIRVLNPIGTTIWQMVVDNEDLATIENYLVENYEVSQERAHEDLLAFIEELFDRGILVPVDVVS